MQSVTKEYVLPLLNSATDAEVIPGDMVRLHLTDSIPGLPTPILAVVQHPIDRIMVINPATNCRVNGYRYTFLYNEAQLEEVVEAITECDIISVETTSCCELLSEQIAAETAARIAADNAIVAGVGAVKYSEDQGLNQTQRGIALQNILPLVEGSPYTATLAPAGANNYIAISYDVALTDAEIVIDNVTDRTGLVVGVISLTLTVAAGDKRNMVVTGDLETAAGQAVAGVYAYMEEFNSAPRYRRDFEDGSVVTIQRAYDTAESEPRPFRCLIFRYIDNTLLIGTLVARSDIYAIGATPDNAVGWANVNSSTGTPTITAATATAAQVIAAINTYDPPGLVATNAPGSDGSGFVVAETAGFSPTPETSLPPSGTFTSSDGQLITVTNGIITSMVLP